MSSKIHTSERVTLSHSALRNMDQNSQPRHTPFAQGYTNLASLKVEDDDLSSQDNFSLCSGSHTHGNLHDFHTWSLSDADAVDSGAVSSCKPESPDVQMLSFSFSQQLLPSTVGPSDVVYQPGPDFSAVQDLNDHHDMDYSQAQDFSHYSSFVDFSAFDNDSSVHNGSQSCTDDSLSVGHSSHTDDGHLAATNEAWNSMMADTRNYHRSSLDGLPSSIFQSIPVSPPLTEASHDLSVTSCSHSGYPSFMAHDDAMLKDVTAAPHGINPGEPLLPLTPPVNEQDPNRTIRPSKQARRPALQTTPPQPSMKQDPDFFPPLPREPLSRRSKEIIEMKNPRDHPYYTMPTHSDGKYYCPFTNGEKSCSHPPTTQKCAYHKYLDSHLKPYRCKVPACMDAQLQFSSNACLFRHEREAHGLHGHGDNPHLCLFEGCDRSVPGYGFPRRWNLFDHMRRVHDYTCSERPSSPETSPVISGQASKKKETIGRKKKVLGTSGAQTMKRTRSTQSQKNPLKAAHQATAHHGQRLQNAERNYYNCRSRLLEEIGTITPQDSPMHEKVNASLQELITLGLNYRHIEASQTTAKLARGIHA